ncbi:MAG: hypothetical protein KDC95_03710 [Planctomycetes bacterium]|nr:hypothetical protein [Planctomycetota bacterium]
MHSDSKLRAARLFVVPALFVVALVAGSCSKSPTKPQASGNNSTIAQPTGSGAAPKTEKAAQGNAHGSKTPSRPLPRLADATVSSIRKHVADAKTAYNEAIKVHEDAPSDKDTFFAALNRCKNELDAADAELQPVTLWEEESSMEDWKVSAEEDGYLRTLMPILGQIDKMRAAAEKISRPR